MGYYINKLATGRILPPKGKANALVNDGATIVDGSSFQPDLICVVENGYFEAAAFVYSQAEYDEFATDDGRPKVWLTHPKAAELAGYNQ